MAFGLWLATGAAAVALLVARAGMEDDGTPALLAEPWPAPALDLSDPQGRTVGLDDFSDRVLAVFFGYTWCPDVCPITLAQLSRLQDELDPEAERLQIVFVSLDPARDTPERLERWTAAFHPSLRALTGPLDELRRTAWDWGIGFRYRILERSPFGDSVAAPREHGATGEATTDAAAQLAPGMVVDDPPPTGPYLVDHTSRTFLIDREGLVIAQISPEMDGQTLEKAVRAALQR